MQLIKEGIWHVESLSGSNPDGYTITRHSLQCSECSFVPKVPKPCVEICTATDCDFLCLHMYACDSKCYDYNNGHICKHIHRVHSLTQLEQVDPTLNCSTAQEEEEEEEEENSNTEIAYAESMFDSKKG